MNTVLVPVGSTRAVDFIADNPGDWPFHCHMTHHVMNQMGHGVPNMVGFDGSEEGAYTTPTLTTVAPDKAAIAARAVERIGVRVAGADLDGPQEIVTPFRLEVRESTAG